MTKKNPEWFELGTSCWAETKEDGYRSFRDSQRQKLYDAEYRFALMMWPGMGDRPTFKSIKEIQEFADKFMKSAWVHRRFGHQRPVIIREHANLCDAWRGDRSIRLAKWGWCISIVLHELCHILVPGNFGNPHGRFFCRLFLEVIEHKLGSRARKLLKKQYQFYGVKHSSKPQYSEEAKLKMKLRGQELANRYLVPAATRQK